MSPIKTPRLAVVVCTSDRPDVIGAAVESLVAQVYAPSEIVVVDQSSGPETRDVVTAIGVRDARVRYLHLNQKGLSRAYNTGVEATTAELIAFTDDDCVAPPNWTSNVVTAFAERPHVDLVYGQVLVPETLAAEHGQTGVTPALAIPRRRLMGRGSGFQVFGMGANFAARRTVFATVGGFDEVLGGGAPLKSTQDFDYAYRVYRSGGAILLEPDLQVFHHSFRDIEAGWPATVRSYGVGVGGFYAKHVRMGDAFALYLFVRHVVHELARLGARVLRRRAAWPQWLYVSHVFAGIRCSFKFKIDTQRCVYVAEPTR